MTETGYRQKRASPLSLAIVLALHAGALTAVLMIKGPVRSIIDGTIDYYPVPEPKAPEPLPEPPRPQPRTDDQQITRTTVPTPLPTPFPPLPDRPIDTGTTDLGPIGDPIPLPTPDPPRPDPVRREAQVDRRYADALQPPYPLSEHRAQRSGTVRIRVTIGVDGRVRAVERLSATNDAFWEAAERQALNRWRFRPATVDGRPVESTKVMTVQFRIADV
jgi:protein TonB